MNERGSIISSIRKKCELKKIENADMSNKIVFITINIELKSIKMHKYMYQIQLR